MNQRNRTLLLAAAVAGMLSTTGLRAADAADATATASADKVKCYGANACKGQGACGGAGRSCAGSNACKGQGYLETETKEECLKMDGGRLTPTKS